MHAMLPPQPDRTTPRLMLLVPSTATRRAHIACPHCGSDRIEEVDTGSRHNAAQPNVVNGRVVGILWISGDPDDWQTDFYQCGDCCAFLLLPDELRAHQDWA